MIGTSYFVGDLILFNWKNNKYNNENGKRIIDQIENFELSQNFGFIKIILNISTGFLKIT